MLATTNFETIATHYLGEKVWVDWRASAHWQGLALRMGAGPVIFLNPSAVDLAFVFWHELGHHVCGHCTIINRADYGDLGAADSDAILANMTPAERAYFEPMIDERENEADGWALTHLAAFERRFGPFLAAMYDA